MKASPAGSCLERLVVLGDHLDLGGVDGALLAVEGLPLGVVRLLLPVKRQLLLQIRQDLGNGKI